MFSRRFLDGFQRFSVFSYGIWDNFFLNCLSGLLCMRFTVCTRGGMILRRNLDAWRAAALYQGKNLGRDVSCQGRGARRATQKQQERTKRFRAFFTPVRQPGANSNLKNLDPPFPYSMLRRVREIDLKILSRDFASTLNVGGGGVQIF